MDRKAYLKDYCSKHHKDTYVSDTSKRDAKNKKALGMILLDLAYTANRDGAKLVSIYESLRTEIVGYAKDYLDGLIFDGWSDILVTNLDLIAKTVEMPRTTVMNYIKKANEQNYIISLGKYKVEEAKYPSNAYMINIEKIHEDFSDMWKDHYEVLGNRHYSLISKNDKKSIELNNECMKHIIWRNLKAMIDAYNATLPTGFGVHFFEETEDGYEYGRYYNDICNTKNPEKHVNDTKRFDKLREYFNVDDNDFEEYDVNAMMLRTSYDLINNEPLSKSKDVYYELYTKMVISPISQSEFKKSSLREHIKKNVMSIYMKPQSVYLKKNNKVDDSMLELNAMQEEYNKHDIEQLEALTGMSYFEFLERLKEAMYQFLSIYDFEGDLRVFFGRMYFKYEAIVYYMMRKAFREIGIDTINVYDGFYFLHGVCNEELFYNIYHKAINMTKDFLNEHNHDLVKLYGKKIEKLKYKIYPKKETKYEPKATSYQIPSTKTEEVIVTETAEEHSAKQQAYVDSVIAKAKEYEAQGLQAYF